MEDSPSIASNGGGSIGVPLEIRCSCSKRCELMILIVSINTINSLVALINPFVIQLAGDGGL